MRIRHARALDEVDALADAWQSMHCSAASPFAQFGWVRACLSAFPDEGTPHVVAGWRDAELAAVAPLVKRRSRGVCRLFPVGSESLGEPVQFVETL